MKKYLHNGKERLSVTQIVIIRALCKRWDKPTDLSNRLYLHRNTIIYHLKEIKRKTGLDPYCYHDMTKLLELLEDNYTDELGG